MTDLVRKCCCRLRYSIQGRKVYLYLLNRTDAPGGTCPVGPVIIIIIIYCCFLLTLFSGFVFKIPVTLSTRPMFKDHII